MAVKVHHTNQNLNGIMEQILIRQRGVARDLLRRGHRVEEAAKRNVMKTNDTGKLRMSIHTQLHVRRNRPVVTVGTPMPYAPFIHNGTRDHGPKHASVMAWYGRDGNIIFARKVRGIKANPFLTDALAAVPD